jgi:ribonuclease P protein component
MALKKSLRLKKKKDIQAVKQKGEIYHTPLFSVLYLENKNDGPKFGFVVSKKIDKIAVKRNKIRRQLAEAVRKLMPKLRQDIFALFLVKSKIKLADFDQIKKNILKIKPIFRE